MLCHVMGLPSDSGPLWGSQSDHSRHLDVQQRQEVSAGQSAALRSISAVGLYSRKISLLGYAAYLPSRRSMYSINFFTDADAVS